MDGEGTAVDLIVPHALENDMGAANCVNDDRETGFGQDIGGTTSSVGGTLDGNTDVGTG